MYKSTKCWAFGIAVLLLVGAPVLADDMIYRGADVWSTTAGGFTYSTFEHDPIPADFFCEGSLPFTGNIAFEGAPLATEPARQLGTVDTIVERLDDAPFDQNGVAVTRIQLLAMSLASRDLLENECGTYHVAVSLDGKQPITEMKIFKDSDFGGSYEAPLELRIKMVFTPVAGEGTTRELSRDISLGPGTFSVWSHQERDLQAAKVKVDTTNDGIPDQYLPGPSNFVAGVAPVAFTATTADRANCPYTSCHCNPVPTDWDAINDPNEWVCHPSHKHCIDTYVPCHLIPDRDRPRFEPYDNEPYEHEGEAL
ncbi:MAG: hypothetical protein AAF604_13100 [Acidobacteriota bacterium]